jgi:cytidine deaminase
MAANAAGEEAIEAIAVAGHKFTPPTDRSLVVTPCGRCRQLLLEAAQRGGTEIRILACRGDLTRIVESTISELLPAAFGPANLGLAAAWPQLREALARAVAEWTGPKSR